MFLSQARSIVFNYIEQDSIMPAAHLPAKYIGKHRSSVYPLSFFFARRILAKMGWALRKARLPSFMFGMDAFSMNKGL